MGVSSPVQHGKESLCFEAECERAKTTHKERIRKHSDWIIPLRGPKLVNFGEKTDKTLHPLVSFKREPESFRSTVEKLKSS